MPKPTKTTGYDVLIRAFVPAKSTDQKLFADLQSVVAHIEESLNALGGIDGQFDILPTRR